MQPDMMLEKDLRVLHLDPKEARRVSPLVEIMTVKKTKCVQELFVLQNNWSSTLHGRANCGKWIMCATVQTVSMFSGKLVCSGLLRT